MIERWVYDLVKHRPWLKDFLKKAYQLVFSLTGRKDEFYPETLVLREHCFFGFHDKSPWSNDNSHLLAHRYNGVGNEDEKAINPVSVTVYSGKDWLTQKEVASTSAWNWQQGAQLQWLGNSRNIIFNDFVDGVCRAVSFNLKGVRIQVFPYPVAAVSPDASLFAAFCFKTFGEAMPGYGYDFEGAKSASNVPPDTLLIFDSAEAVKRTIVGPELPRAEEQTHDSGISFISHVIFSKSGEKVAFMRRLATPGRRLKSALYTLDCITGQINRLPFNDMVSHYCWLNDDTIFAYANDEYDDGYFEVTLSTGSIKNYSSLLGRKDGHPHSDATGSLVVFDSYPDKKRLQRLALLEVDKGKVHDLGRIFSPMKFWGDKRVDLHPRIRQDGNYICVDCSTNGVRTLATLRVSQGMK